MPSGGSAGPAEPSNEFVGEALFGLRGMVDCVGHDGVDSPFFSFGICIWVYLTFGC